MAGHTDLLDALRIDHRHRETPAAPPRWPWLAGGAALLLALAGAAAWRLHDGAIAVATTTAIAPAAVDDAGAVLQATGYVTARRQATVSAQITGTLTAVLIEEGDRVDQGQVLARLDDSGYRASLAAARAQAAAAHAQVAQYRAQLAQNERDAQRDESLAARGLMSKQLAEQARTQAEGMRAQLAAQQRQAAAADAQVGVAQVNFDYTVVRAPFAGVITTKDAQVGEIVSPLSAGGGYTRTGVGTVVDMDSLEVDVDVNEAYIGRVAAGMAAEATLDAYPDWKIPAHVIAIVPAADRGKATVKVRVALERKDGRIVPDMGARVAFLEHRRGPAPALRGVLVPAAAIVQRDGGAAIFVLAGGHAQRRMVRPAVQRHGELRLIPEGVAAGDTVILAPPAALRDGAAARPRPASND